MVIGGVIWLWNMVQSARVGPVVDRDDPWGLEETDQLSREWHWFEQVRRRVPAAVADGGSDVGAGEPPAGDGADGAE